MDKVSRKVHKASTHIALSLIRVDGATGERHCATIDQNTATLPADAKLGKSNGVMEEMSRKVQEVRTYSKLPSECSR